MSDYYDDSFESESGSENGEQREEGEQAEAVGSSGVSSQQSAATTTTTRELHVAPNLLASPRLSLALRGHGSGSDRDEQETSRWRESKSERSPRPRRKFRVKKPNIGSFTQKIKNKLKKDSAVFGVTVEVAIQRSTLGTDQLELPTIFRQCIDFLEEHGVNHQGVYRLPGVKSKVEELKSHFDKGEVVDLSEQDPNTVASLLKLYLRELPEPLIPHSSLSGRIDNIFDLSEEEQSEILREVVDTLQTPNRLLLSWLLEHMTHIVGKSGVNKMTLPNMVIVFSPTLQLPAHFFHTLYNHKHNIFGDVPLTRFEKPAVVRKSNSKQIEIVNIDLLETEQDVNTELDRLTSLLMKRHSKVAGKFNSREEDMWILQRSITALRRKKKAIQKSNKDIEREAEEEFMKTLLLMEATLKAENEELLERKAQLQEAIKKEAELIDQYKVEMKKFPRRSVRFPSVEDDESGDEAELAKKIATLKWHSKEMEMRNKNLVQSIRVEDVAILNLRVKLRVLPLSKELQVEQD